MEVDGGIEKLKTECSAQIVVIRRDGEKETLKVWIEGAVTTELTDQAECVKLRWPCERRCGERDSVD